jgi:cation-transporting ATPase 13A2
VSRHLPDYSRFPECEPNDVPEVKRPTKFWYIPFTVIMALTGPSEPHDYTEGASAIEINAAAAHARRHSSYGGDSGQGAMFDGPGQESIPTSMSRMSYTEHGFAGRRSREWSRGRMKSEESIGRSSRRMSTDGEVPLAADGTRSDSEEEAGGDDEGINHRGRRRRRSISPTFNRSSVFENIANLFSRGTGERRSSLSRRSSASSTRKSRRRSSDAGSEFAHADEVNERWGYSSGEEDDETESDGSHPLNPFHNEIDYGSYPPSPSAGSHLPLFAADAIFGDEVRIDIDIPQEPLNPPPPGPPSRQTIYVPEEDNTFRFVGYEVIIWRQWLWRLCCAATLGVVGLLGHWFPRIWLRCVVEEKAFRDIKHGCVVVEVRNAINVLQNHL